ncbi:hypothetical protein Tco_1533050 [Tanacetum coccineum]
MCNVSRILWRTYKAFNARPWKHPAHTFVNRSAKCSQSFTNSYICQEENEEDDDEDEEIKLMAWNFRNFFRKGNRFGRQNRFGNSNDKLGKGFNKHDKFDICGNNDKNNGVESSRQERDCYHYGDNNHLIGDCPKPKENKSFVGGEQLAGVALLASVVNYWWSSFPSNIMIEAYKLQPRQDQWEVNYEP